MFQFRPRVVGQLLARYSGRELPGDLGYYSNRRAVCNARCEIAAEDDEFQMSVREDRSAGRRQRGRNRNSDIRRPARQQTEIEQRAVADCIDAVVFWLQRGRLCRGRSRYDWVAGLRWRALPLHCDFPLRHGQIMSQILQNLALQYGHQYYPEDDDRRGRSPQMRPPARFICRTASLPFKARRQASSEPRNHFKVSRRCDLRNPFVSR